MKKSGSVMAAALLALTGNALAGPDYFATKADERAGHRTPGNPPAVKVVQPNAGGDTCATATVIAATPYTDTGDTTNAVNDVGTLPAGCSTYTTVGGPDHIYVFTAGAVSSLAFSVTPTTGTYDPAIYVLGTCGTTATCVIGHDLTLAGQAETLPAQAYAAGTHAVYVDSYYAQGAACPGQANILCGNGAYTFDATGTLPAELLNLKIE